MVVAAPVLDLFHKLIEFIRHPNLLFDDAGPWAMALLAVIIFVETGALVFFLPGDSLLVTAGLYAAAGSVPYVNILSLNALLIPVAILGDALSYYIGVKSGPKLFNRPRSRFFRPEYLRQAQAFYEKHGGKAIIIARFMPIVRTFVPVIAGMAKMPYRRFAAFNVVGGAAWVSSMTVLGYVLGKSFPDVGKHIEKVIVLIVFLSILPGIISAIRAKLAASAAKGKAAPDQTGT